MGVLFRDKTGVGEAAGFLGRSADMDRDNAALLRMGHSLEDKRKPEDRGTQVVLMGMMSPAASCG